MIYAWEMKIGDVRRGLSGLTPASGSVKGFLFGLTGIKDLDEKQCHLTVASGMVAVVSDFGFGPVTIVGQAEKPGHCMHVDLGDQGCRYRNTYLELFPFAHIAFAPAEVMGGPAVMTAQERSAIVDELLVIRRRVEMLIEQVNGEPLLASFAPIRIPPKSEYELDCVCGEKVRGNSTEMTCQKCGAQIVAEWGGGR